MFDGKKVLITGGTGSLGQALTNRLLETDVETIRIFSREEFKQVKMQSEINDKRLRFLIGDIRDKERLWRALEDIDIVIHAAALKHVPVAEYNPFEAVKTNVYGSQNLIEACLDREVKTVLAVGTDKAVSPLNTYGATKLLMERLFIAANNYKGKHITKFLCVRYGNVLGSRGSIVPNIIDKIKNEKPIQITDTSMTRFNITMNQALDLIFRALTKNVGGEILVPKLKAYRLGDLVEAMTELLDTKPEIEKIPVRQGEKYHEMLINKHEIRNVFETKDDYIIFEKQCNSKESDIVFSDKTSLKDEYSSDKVKLLSKQELKDILNQEQII